MKTMKNPHGTARLRRRAIEGAKSAESVSATLNADAAAIRKHLRILTVTLFHKAATAKLAKLSPFR